MADLSNIKRFFYICEKNTCNLFLDSIIYALHWGVSSAGLERLPVTQKVEGSSPLHPARIFTAISAVFKSPWPHRLMVRTPPFQGENPGSNPSGAAKIQNPDFLRTN